MVDEDNRINALREYILNYIEDCGLGVYETGISDGLKDVLKKIDKLWTEGEKMKIIDCLEYELEDDDTEYGGIAFLGEKVKDFFDDINGNGGNGGIPLLLSDDIEVLNKVLKDCGIKEIKESEKED